MNTIIEDSIAASAIAQDDPEEQDIILHHIVEEGEEQEHEELDQEHELEHDQEQELQDANFIEEEADAEAARDLNPFGLPVPHPDFPFPCVICNQRFLVPSEVGKHIEGTHMAAGPAMCDLCGKVFKTQGGMSRHKRTHTGEKPYKCSHCSACFAQWSTWRKHELIHLKSKAFQCHACEAYFDKEKDFLDHDQICQGPQFECCGEKFDNRPDFVQHQTKRHRRAETKIHTCKYCDKAFTLYTDKRIHEEAHLERKNPNNKGATRMGKCPRCRKFVARGSMDKHLETCGLGVETGDESHKCDLCDAVFVERRDMFIHRKSHDNANNSFPCSVCSKVLKSRASRYMHMKYHSKNKKHKCTYCEKAFVIKAHMVTHLRMHTKEKPFGCTICGKKFAHDQSRRLHEQIHSQEKAFKCNYCAKRFNSAQSRISHERFHTGERPYECKFCSQKFIRLNTLKCHERVHTGEKPYACDICGKTFAQQSTCASHRKTHKEKVHEMMDMVPIPPKKIMPAPIRPAVNIVNLHRPQPQIHHPAPHIIYQPQGHHTHQNIETEEVHGEWVYDHNTGTQMYVVVNNEQYTYQT